MTRRAAVAASPLACMAVLIGWLLALAGPVLAAEPPTLTRPVTDIAERLVGDEAKIAAVLDDLQERRGIRLWVVTLDTIDGEDPALFADQIAAANQLGDEEAVLFISFEDRQFGLWAGEGLALSIDQIDELLVPLGDALRAGDPGGGIAITATNLEASVDGSELDPGPWGNDPGEVPFETIPPEEVEPDPGDPGPIIDPGDPGFPVDEPFPFPQPEPRAPTPIGPILLGLAGIAALGGAGLGGRWVVGRRREIAGVGASAAAIAERAVAAATTGRSGTDALAAGFGEATAAPFAAGVQEADLTLAQVRAARSRLGSMRGLSLAPRQAVVAELERLVSPMESWAGVVAAERAELEGLRAVADERLADLVDALPAVRTSVASAQERIDGLGGPSPSAQRALLTERDGLAADLAVAEDQARAAAAALVAERRAPGVLALRAALQARAAVEARLARVDEAADRVDQAVAERERVEDEAAAAIATAGDDLAASPIPELTARLEAARAAVDGAHREADVLLAWQALREAAHDAGAIHAEVVAARRRAREALEAAQRSVEAARDATQERSDVRGSTKQAFLEVESRFSGLVAAMPSAPQTLRAAAQAVADEADAIRMRADRDVRDAEAERDRHRMASSGAAAGFMSSSSSSDASSASSSSSSSSSSGSGHGGGTSSGGSW